MEKSKELIITKEEMTQIKSKFHVLSDSDLNEVSGGFESNDGVSWGYNVMCPNCGNDNINTIRIGPKFRYGIYDSFFCNACRQPFGVDGDGWTFSLKA